MNEMETALAAIGGGSLVTTILGSVALTATMPVAAPCAFFAGLAALGTYGVSLCFRQPLLFLKDITTPGWNEHYRILDKIQMDNKIIFASCRAKIDLIGLELMTTMLTTCKGWAASIGGANAVAADFIKRVRNIFQEVGQVGFAGSPASLDKELKSFVDKCPAAADMSESLATTGLIPTTWTFNIPNIQVLNMLWFLYRIRICKLSELADVAMVNTLALRNMYRNSLTGVGSQLN